MIPIVTPEEMAAIDAAAPDPVEVLIRRAAGAVASEARALMGGTYGRRVVVLAGKGNNGNDGRVAAEILEGWGVRATVFDVAEAPGELPACDLVLDAAFGTGFRGTWDPPGHGSAPVLAVDIPSGVSGLTGEACGSPWHAVRTVTFAALKPGLIQGDGPVFAGEVVLADIGLDTSPARAQLTEDADVAAWVPPRRPDDHKWRHAVWVVAGSPGMEGAGWLCSHSAGRGGATYVRASSPGVERPDAPREAVGVALPATGWGAEVADGSQRFGAVVCGPGLGRGEGLRAELDAVVGAGVPVVLDADALRAIGTQPLDSLRSGTGSSGRGGPEAVVMTPHDGEYESLVGHPPGADRFAAAREAAELHRCVVLLKGPTTVVADPSGAALAAHSGDARLATAGSGDVLSGLIGAHLAAGAEPLRAAAAAAHLHGVAGRLAGRYGVLAGDIADALGDARALLTDGGPSQA